MYQGKKQIYGTQARSRETGEYFIWPIENPVYLNTRRKETGFSSTVEEIAARLNARYDPDEPLQAQCIFVNN